MVPYGGYIRDTNQTLGFSRNINNGSDVFPKPLTMEIWYSVAAIPFWYPEPSPSDSLASRVGTYPLPEGPKYRTRVFRLSILRIVNMVLGRYLIYLGAWTLRFLFVEALGKLG